MPSTRKIAWKVALVFAAALALVAVAGLAVLQSDWFRNEIRKRIVAQVESATGGNTEIGGFDYDWKQRTAYLNRFVIHGTELPPADPLFRVQQAAITIRIVSVFERKADVSSIVLTRPRVNLIVAPDGTTNLPTPPAARSEQDPIASLFALELNRFAVDDGLIVMNDRRIPVNVHAEAVNLAAAYSKAAPSYEIALSSGQVDLGFGEIGRGPFRLAAEASLLRDRALLRKFELADGGGKISGVATLDHFARPAVDFHLQANALVDDVLPIFKLDSVRGGKFTASGAGRYTEADGFSFKGKVDAQQSAIRAPGFSLRNASASAEVDVNPSRIALHRIAATAHGAKLSGDAVIENRRDFSFDGNVSSLSLREAAAFVSNKSLPWQGVARGRIHATATLDARARDFALQSDLSIAPVANGIPVSGELNLKYSQKANSLDFGESHLTLPHSVVLFSGPLRGENRVVLDSNDLEDFWPLIPWLALDLPHDEFPALQPDGQLHFDGAIAGLFSSVTVAGDLKAAHLRFQGETLDRLAAKFSAGESGIDIASLDAGQDRARVSGTGSLGLTRWSAQPSSPLRGAFTIHSLDAAKILSWFPDAGIPNVHGVVSADIQLHNTFGQPEGVAHVSATSLDAFGEKINSAQLDAEVAANRLRISQGRIVAQPAVLAFSGDYEHRSGSWSSGQARVRIDSNGFPLGALTLVHAEAPALNARANIHFETAASIAPGKFEPAEARGTIQLAEVTWNRIPYGDLSLKAETRGQSIAATLTGDFRKNPLHGAAEISLLPGNRTTAEIAADRVTLASIYSLAGARSDALFDGEMQAAIHLDGSLQNPRQMHISLASEKMELRSRLPSNDLDNPDDQAQLLFHNSSPLAVDIAEGVATVHDFKVEGNDTHLEVAGSIPLAPDKQMNLKVGGVVNLQAYHLFDRNVKSSGTSTIAASVGGSLANPTVNGTLDIANGSFLPANFPNGLSEVNGRVVFTQNRATLQKMTAKTGGGELALTGFLSFPAGSPLIYHLEGSADNVRVRYAGTISVTASSRLRLSGTSNNGLLSGTITVSRVVFNTNTDVGNILAGLGAPTASSGDNDFLTGVRLDVAIENAPNMQLSTSLSRDVDGVIALRLRGTPDHPVIQGNLAVNQGDIQVFGNRFTINRGEISFSNPVKVEPVLDLDLQTRARGVTVDITVSGVFSKLNIAYRSDPPMQPREIIALLSLGRAPDSSESRSVRTNDTTTLQSPANSLLGAAVTSPVTNRLSKLFGITNIRIDPLVQGITNTPQTRLTLEQQISRDVTITYVTNLSQTSEQIFRFEWAFSPQYSVVALRDDNGEFGIDFQYKKQFK